MGLKVCTTCRKWKDSKDFNRNASRRDGLQSQCRGCKAIADAKYRSTPTGRKNHAKASAKYQRTPAGRKSQTTPAACASRAKSNKTVAGRKRQARYRSTPAGRKSQLKAQTKYYSTPTGRAARAKYEKGRYAVDVNFKLACNLRKRLRKAIKKAQRAGSAVRDLGCTIPELKVYLEALFKPGMAWDNWSLEGWHIDHIRPLASFDLTDREQFLQACHYTNLQPLWAKENLSKRHLWNVQKLVII